MNFLSELKRRNVYKVAVAYAFVAWLLIQIATATFPVLEIPNWATKLVIVLVVLGFTIALILVWAFELTPQVIQRAADADAAGESPRRGWSGPDCQIVRALGASATHPHPSQ